MKKFTVLILAFALVFTTLLTTGCQTTEEAQVFDFLGAWTLTTNFDGYDDANIMTLSGTLTSGTATIPGMDSGTYTSANNQINLTFYLGTLVYSFVGTVTSSNFMSGTFITNLTSITGTWQATR